MAFLVVIEMVFSFLFVNVSAVSAESEKIAKSTTINEWEQYNDIVSSTDADLKQKGYTEAEIAEIRSFDYEKEIRNRASLSDEMLYKYGYSDSEITELRNAAKLEDIPVSVMKTISSATMTTTLRYLSNGSRVEGGKTMYYVNMKFSWSWSRIPIFRLFDIVVVAFDSSTADKFSYCVQSSNQVHAKLKELSTSKIIDRAYNWTLSTKYYNSIYVKFPICNHDVNANVSHFVYNGYGTFQLTNRSNKARLFVDACYGHTTTNIVPSFSISGTGPSLNVSLVLGMDDQHCTGYFFENFTISKNYIYHGTVYGKSNSGGSV